MESATLVGGNQTEMKRRGAGSIGRIDSRQLISAGHGRKRERERARETETTTMTLGGTKGQHQIILGDGEAGRATVGRIERVANYHPPPYTSASASFRHASLLVLLML